MLSDDGSVASDKISHRLTAASAAPYTAHTMLSMTRVLSTTNDRRSNAT
jgi:hypothetical protein